jgi:hypothetical protein
MVPPGGGQSGWPGWTHGCPQKRQRAGALRTAARGRGPADIRASAGVRSPGRLPAGGTADCQSAPPGGFGGFVPQWGASDHGGLF